MGTLFGDIKKSKLVNYGLAEAVSKSLNISVLFLLPLLVAVDEFGFIALMIITEQVLVMTLMLGQNTALLRFLPKFSNKNRVFEAVRKSVIKRTLLIVVLLIFCLAYFVATLNFKDGVALVLTLCTVPFLINIEITLAKYRAVDQVQSYVFLRLFFQILKIVFVIVLFAYGFSLGSLSYSLGVLIAASISSFLLLAFTEKSKTKFTSNKKVTKLFFIFGLPLGLQVGINIFYTVTDRYLLSYFVGLEDVSIYSFSYSVATTVLFAIQIVIISFISDVYKNSLVVDAFSELNKLFARSLIFVGLLSLIIYLIVFPLILDIYPDEYARGKEVVKWILISNLFHVGYLFAFYRLTIVKKVKLIPIFTLGAFLVNLILNIVLIPIYFIEGAAVSTAISELFLFICLLLLSFHRAELNVKRL
ncbi:oligosaccharide flippase family protein [Glaciecola sp. MF2-115]|uniref:oligosaccharide flippase family protein n=1 Tax=Glaciecola sp. MF2-115 TaxID=3384827 RepID=UPI0039A0BCF8